MAADAFISFAAKDRESAETICSALENRGIECWISSRDIPAGKNFQECIVRAIRDAKVMVFIFSSNSNNSDEVKKEIALAGQKKLLVIPVRIEDVIPNEAFAYEFATRQWIDLFGNWEHSIDELARQIASIDGDGDAERSPTPKPPRRRTQKRSTEDANPDPIGPQIAPDMGEVEAAALYDRANGQARDGNYESAIAQYDELIRIQPHNANAFNNRGAAHQALGRLDQAFADFDRAISLKPDFASAYNNRGNAHQTRNQLDQAVRDYTIALQFKPDFITARQNRASAYDRKGLADEARKDRAAVLAMGGGVGGTGGAGPPPSPPPNGAKAIMIAFGALAGLMVFAVIVGVILKPSSSTSVDSSAAASTATADSSSQAADASSANSATTPPAANPTTHVITLVNSTGQAMTGFFATPPQTQSWGDSLIASQLDTGYQISVTINDPAGTCIFDVRGVFADKSSSADHNINFCQIDKYTFNGPAAASSAAPAN